MSHERICQVFFEGKPAVVVLNDEQDQHGKTDVMVYRNFTTPERTVIASYDFDDGQAALDFCATTYQTTQEGWQSIPTETERFNFESSINSGGVPAYIPTTKEGRLQVRFNKHKEAVYLDIAGDQKGLNTLAK